jgi:hypothetical protein
MQNLRMVEYIFPFSTRSTLKKGHRHKEFFKGIELQVCEYNFE